MNPRIVAFAGVLTAAGALLVALAGCDGAGDNNTGRNALAPASASAAAKQPADARETAVAFANCMRANGDPAFPDPVQDENGRWAFPSSTYPINAPTACQDLSRGLKGGGGDPRHCRPRT